MNSKVKRIGLLLLLFVLLLSACDGDDQETAATEADMAAEAETGSEMATTEPDMTTKKPDMATTEPDMTATEPAEAEAGGEEQTLSSWLQQVNNDEIEAEPIDETLEWNDGYLVYYGPLESLGLDNLIYNALEARRRLDTGEVTEDNLSQSQQNLLTITEEMAYDSEAELTEQVAQTPEVRSAIMEHVVQSQQDLSPQEALDSDNIVGVFGPPAAESIGSKYLVYGQETPDAEFEFLGVILAVDASRANQEPYSVGQWESLRWLGDATGPFWDDLPAGASGDPANTNEGRPGVLLISEATFDQLQTGDLQS